MAKSSPEMSAPGTLDSDTFTLTPGDSPLLISMPHVGTAIPDGIAAGLTPAALAVPDTDWHIDRLYGFARDLGAGILRARFSRTVVDLNRDPAGVPLYPGADNTELCPTGLFDRQPIYRGAPPDTAEIERRRQLYWQPYHAALAAELARVRQRFGIAVLYDAHSIRSVVPRFFEGTLPTFNVGTGGGAAADPVLAERVLRACSGLAGHEAVLNGRFKGGYITRHYGDPAGNVHAVQMELAQIAYMDEEPPFAYAPARAETLQAVLRAVVETVLDWARRR